MDRNFDNIAEKFARKIYGSNKGRVRTELMRRHLWEVLPFLRDTPMEIWDAGGGSGEFAVVAAQAGHSILLTDLSKKMMEKAEATFREKDLSPSLQTETASIQEAARSKQGQFSLVFCHAVLEWTQDPASILDALLSTLKPEGYLSLAYFNLNGIIIKNLVKGGFQKVRKGDFAGYRNSLTPINPIDPTEMTEWLAHRPVRILSRAGIRCFSDYMHPEAKDMTTEAEVLELEWQHSRKAPFLDMARYIHLILQKK